MFLAESRVNVFTQLPLLPSVGPNWPDVGPVNLASESMWLTFLLNPDHEKFIGERNGLVHQPFMLLRAGFPDYPTEV